MKKNNNMIECIFADVLANSSKLAQQNVNEFSKVLKSKAMRKFLYKY